MSSKQAEYQII